MSLKSFVRNRLILLQLQLLLLSITCIALHQGQREPPLQLDAAAVRSVLSDAMRCQNLPHLHVAVVHAGLELYSFRLELQPDGVVDILNSQQKLIPIASVSKGMFATVLPRVQEWLRKERKDPSFDLLTTPIKELLGDQQFWFLDPTRTDSVTIEDLTSHTTGLRRHDSLSIYFGANSKAELVQRMGRFNATGKYRGSFIYNNLVWTLADKVVERLTGRNFSAYMREFLWRPLGMSETFGSSELDARSYDTRLFRLPTSFNQADASFERTELERSLDLVEAAGGIYVTLANMVKYMQHHTLANYSSDAPFWQPFKAVNAFAAANPPINPKLFNDSVVADLPEIDLESYGHGWSRTWYNGNLAFEHGGSLFDAHCYLRVLPKRRISVFTHASMGPSDSPFQSAYPNILANYVTDLLTRNSSFVRGDSVCNLFKPLPLGQPTVVPRRQLTDADMALCVGSFGDFGFGSLTVSLNETIGQLVAAYGNARMAMTSVKLHQADDAKLSFFLSMLRPVGLPMPTPIMEANASHVMVRPGVLQQSGPPQTLLFMQIWRQQPSSGGGAARVVLNSPVLDAEALLEKGLQPESWQRPEPCPPGGKGAAGRLWGGVGTTTLAFVGVFALRWW